MSTSSKKQKDLETHILENARRACSVFPPGDIEPFEEPDLRIKIGDGWLYIEVTELVRPETENAFRPVQSESFHQEVVRLAEKLYYSTSGAKPAHVSVAFLDDEQCKLENLDGWQRLADRKSGRKAEKMARSLADFVTSHYPQGTSGSVTFKKRPMAGQMDSDTLPTGFEVVSISTPGGPWSSGESGNLVPLDYEYLADTIRKKNDLLPNYKEKVGNSSIWLLIASGPSISRGVPISRSIDDWRFPFDFDRVLLFSAMDNRVFDIGRSSSNRANPKCGSHPENLQPAQSRPATEC